MPILLILGAASDMAVAAARVFASHGWSLQLAGRDLEYLDKVSQDLRLRHQIAAKVFFFDALDHDGHKKFWSGLDERPDAVLCAVGLLGDQTSARHDFALADRILRTNFNGLVSILGIAADDFEAARSGTIIAISSVAGDRGRASNYIYGSAKAGLTAFLSGLRNRLDSCGVRVITIKPGFVKTSMTENMDLPPLFTASPPEVGEVIYKALTKRRDTIYCRSLWRLVMLAIRLIPERIFKKLNL